MVTAGSLVAALAIAVAGALLSPASVALAAAARFPTAIARPAGESARLATVGPVGLTISLKVSPKRVAPGAAVTFRLHLAATHAVGALGYVLSFGDGTSRANPIPMYCMAGSGVSVQHTWRFTHSYRKAGTYAVVARGRVNCSRARVVARATIVVS
jgi:hypothetical protein